MSFGSSCSVSSRRWLAGWRKRAPTTLVGWWESEHREHRVRWYRPDSYRIGGVVGIDPGALGPGRTLLLVHGTNSLSHSASGLGGMPARLVQSFHDAYKGRVIAFDHPTLSKTPEENAAFLVEWLAQCGDVEVDVLVHSRGGLIARHIAEIERPPSVDFRSITFAATPHNGTPLADGKYLGRLFDRLVSLVPFSLAGPVGDIADGAIMAIRQIAEGAFGGLKGVTCMAPGSEFLRQLGDHGRRPDGTVYRALVADFEPTPGSGLWNTLKDRGVDVVFEGHPNDAIIPTMSGLQIGSQQPGEGFDDMVVFDQHDGIRHSSLLADPKTTEMLQAWLQPIPKPLPIAVKQFQRSAAEVQSIAAVGPEWGLGFFDDLVCFAPKAAQDPLRQLLHTTVGRLWPSSTDRGADASKPVAVIVPGIMGSGLSVAGDPVWISPWRLVAGGFRKLRIDAKEVSAEEPLCFAYRRLAEKLDEAGCHVVGLPYDWRLDLAPAADLLNELLGELIASDADGVRDQPVHVVAHSLGCLVVRWARRKQPDLWQKLLARQGRTVLLGATEPGVLRGSAGADWRLSACPDACLARHRRQPQ